MWRLLTCVIVLTRGGHGEPNIGQNGTSGKEEERTLDLLLPIIGITTTTPATSYPPGSLITHILWWGHNHLAGYCRAQCVAVILARKPAFTSITNIKQQTKILKDDICDFMFPTNPTKCKEEFPGYWSAIAPAFWTVLISSESLCAKYQVKTN